MEDEDNMKFCSLASGSSGNCQYIETPEIRVLVDAGLSGKRIQEALNSIEIDPTTLNGIFVTHEHSDHIKGVGILSRRFNIPIYANEQTWLAMEQKLGKISPENKVVFTTNEEFALGDLNVLPFSTYHDAEEPVGYIFKREEKKIALLTDTGTVCEKIRDHIKGAKLILIESNHDEKMLMVGAYPYYLKQRIKSDVGHLSNEFCGQLIVDVHEEEATYLLAHLSRENNTPDLAYLTVRQIVEDAGYALDEDLKIEMTYRDQPTKLYSL